MSEKLNIKIKNLVKTSFFLNPLQRELILVSLKKASKEEKENLIQMLIEEKKVIKESLKIYLLENGKEGIEKVKQILSKTKKEKRNVHKKDYKNKPEKEELKELLDKLEEL